MTQKITIFHNWVHIHSVKTKMSNFLPMKNHDPHQIDAQTSSTQELLKGPHLPCGCNLVAPLGAFVWQTFKNRCPSVRVRPRPSVRPSAIFGKSSRAYSVRNTIFGFIYLGKISRSEKSKIQNVFWYLVIMTTSSFFEEKIKNVLRSIYDPKPIIFRKWVHIHSVETKMCSTFCQMKKSWSTSDWCQTSSTQESLKGPPLPCGCNLVT